MKLPTVRAWFHQFGSVGTTPDTFQQHMEMKTPAAGDAAEVDDSGAEQDVIDPIGLPGRVESIFFFLVVPSKTGTADGAAGRHADPRYHAPGNPTVASGSDSGWFVKSLQDLVNANRVPRKRISHAPAAPDITTWIERRCAARRADTNRKVNRHTDGAPWADYVVVHRSVAVHSAQNLWDELDLLHLCSSRRAKLIIADSSDVGDPTSASEPSGSELRIVVDVACGRGDDPPAPYQNSTRLVLAAATEPAATAVEVVQLHAQGGAVALLGACFGESGPEPPHLRMVQSPKAWTRAQRWLWAVGECPPVYDRCSNPRLEQRDVPLSTRDDAPIFFDIAGREATVGRSAVVMLDARPLEVDPQPSVPQLQPKLLFDYLHNKLADTLMVAFTQRHVLYELSTWMARTGPGEDLDDLVQRIFDFRRVWWWEHLHRHPTSRAFTAFQQYWRLPSLMAQLATEVTDYYQREQQRATSRLNRYGALIAVLATFFGLLQVSGVSRLHRSYLEVGLLGVAVTISIGALLWGVGRARRRRRSAHRWMGRK